MGVVSGDFNICSDQFGMALDGGTEFTEMSKALHDAGLTPDLIHIDKSDPRGSVRTKYVEDAPPGVHKQVLDHAFVSRAFSKGTSAEIVDTRSGERIVSDHLGVSINIEVREASLSSSHRAASSALLAIVSFAMVGLVGSAGGVYVYVCRHRAHTGVAIQSHKAFANFAQADGGRCELLVPFDGVSSK